MKKKSKEYSIPHHGLSKTEKNNADAELRTFRLNSLKKIGENQKVYADLISLKYSILDYLEIGIFSEDYLFSEFLKKYVSITNTTRRKLAENLGVHETKFSKIINNKENPGLGFLYRIEEHSSSLFPASLIWQLVAKKMLIEIDSNTAEKKKQSKVVKNKLRLRTA